MKRNGVIVFFKKEFHVRLFAVVVVFFRVVLRLIHKFIDT